MKSIIQTKRTASGFSLLEVLIAVVVLATGLLALAALQGALARNSADSKARSRVVSLLSNEMDRIRATGYPGIVDIGADGTADAFADSTCTAGGEPCDSVKEAALDAAIGGLTLTRTVREFAKDGATFDEQAPAANNDAQFKHVNVEASWTDATGAPRRLSMTTVLSALSLTADAALVDADPGEEFPPGPIVRQVNPAGAGMIPIAIGEDRDTAATNPRPEVAGKSENQTLPATRYDVLTYQNETSGLARIQRRVETAVVECTCKFETTPSELTGVWALTTFRPSYWDGTQYTIPVDAKEKPKSGPWTGDSTNSNSATVTQSDLCTECCRDRHDVASSDPEYVKYNNFNSDFAKYQATVVPPADNNGSNSIALVKDADGNLVVAGNNQVYIDSCRLNRVDGVWRVATDLYAEHAGLLATEQRGFATSPLPDDDASKAYEGFVIDYLGKYASSTVNATTKPNADSLYESASLNEPAITAGKSDQRFLHGRGLYLDHLEKAAVAKLKEVAQDALLCPKTPTNLFPGCLLPFLPFNTINVTELARWTSSNETILTVTSGSGTYGLANAPIRGVVAAVGGGQADAIIKMGRSNSAVASSLAINPWEASETSTPPSILPDSQSFDVTGNTNTSKFFVQLAGLSQISDASTNNDPVVAWRIIDSTSMEHDGDCFPTLAQDDANPNNYRCVSWVQPLSNPTKVILSNYNLVTQVKENNPCGSSFGKVLRPVLVCNKVTAVTVVSGYAADFTGVSNPKTQQEQTVVSITKPGTGDPLDNSLIKITFGQNGTAQAGMSCANTVTGEVSFTMPTSCP